MEKARASSPDTMRKDMGTSRLSTASVSADTTSLEDDIWNLDLDDIIDNVESPVGKFGMRSNSISSSRVKRNSSFKTRRSPPKRSVSFDKVEIRVFERVLGVDPPACGKGPSIALGWNYSEQEAVDLDKFETKRRLFQWTNTHHHHRHRNSKELLMSPEKRERMAKKLGFSDKDIQTNAKKVEKVLKQRRNTVKALDSNAVGAVSSIKQQARHLHGFR